MSFRRKGERNIQYPMALPVFSVDTEKDAEALQALTCSFGRPGEVAGRYLWPWFYDPDLSSEEMVDKMQEVADRMAKAYTVIQTSQGLKV